MAKIKQNNFLDSVDRVFNDAKRQGILHLYAEDDIFTGRHIRINKQNLFHFGTTGYLGLEQDSRLKQAAVQAIYKYGTQFPLSKTYISHPLYSILESHLTTMYNSPVIITKNSTLGHIGAIPSAVADQDAIILDHQVHWSVQNAAKMLKSRSVHIDMIRHNDLEMLEDKIRYLSSKHKRIWYMADGVYSMFGDVAPVEEIMSLVDKYPQLHLYFDDVHGMSWIGKHGTGYVMDKLKVLPDNVLLFGTLSKTFGASGSVLVCSNKKLYNKIKTFGGPLTFSAQLEPAAVAAGIASAEIHLSPEIYDLQSDLLDRINYFNQLLSKTNLPLVEQNGSPVFYIGTGMPVTGYNFVNRLMKEGFFVNLGIFPAVPIKNTGVRITISRHNGKKEIKNLVEAMEYHFPKALEVTKTTNQKVRKAFKLMVNERNEPEGEITSGLNVIHERSIKGLSKTEWDSLLGKNGVYDSNGLAFMESVFSGNKKKEENWDFHYFIIKDMMDKPIMATFFTYGLWKDDMLAPVSTSESIEEVRKNIPYHMTSYVLAMGSLFTEGDHLFLDTSHPQWYAALRQLLHELELLEQQLDFNLIILRDFDENNKLEEFFHNHGFFQIQMPDSARIDNLYWKGMDNYVSQLSSKSRGHYRRDIEPFMSHVNVHFKSQLSNTEIDHFYKLFENVRQNNLGLNFFPFPKRILNCMSDHPNWEFIVLKLKKEYTLENKELAVGVMFCYKNADNGYVPAFVGMDYRFVRKHNIYRQLLIQTVKRAGELDCNTILLGLTAPFEKRKIGAKITPKFAFVQAKDNYSLERIGILENRR